MKNEAFLYSYTAPRLFERHDYVRQYTPLVRRIAHQMIAKLPANVELDDMIQAGMMGLMDAICRYEESQGTQFEVYASQRVRGAMLDELRTMDWVPRLVRSKASKMEEARKALEAELGRPPRCELAAADHAQSGGRKRTCAFWEGFSGRGGQSLSRARQPHVRGLDVAVHAATT